MLTFRVHHPFDAVASDVEISSLELSGTAGETLSSSLSIGSDRDIEVQLSSSDFAGVEGSVPANCLETFIVKVWQQSGIGVHQSQPYTGGELLLKDDDVDLNDGYRKNYTDWRHLVSPQYVYSPPVVRLSGAARTRICAHQSKQVWLSLSIPTGCRPGSYEGQICITESNGLQHILPVFLQVYPFVLDEPCQDLMLWYRGTLGQRDLQHYVSLKTFREELQDIYNHGFRSFTLSEEDHQLAQLALDTAQQVGFSRNVLFVAPYPERFADLRLGKLTPLFYLSDELDAQTDKADIAECRHVRQHVINYRQAVAAGVKSMSSLIDYRFIRRLENDSDIGHQPDVNSFHLPTSKEHVALNREFSVRKNASTYYYWMAHMEKPNLHRVLAGYYLYKSKADGISPYCYQHRPRFPFSPFDDFEQWEPELKLGAAGVFRHHMATYPCRGGTISTIQWEGMRQGINDLRYLTTLDNLLRKARMIPTMRLEAAVAEAENDVRQFLKKIDLLAIHINHESEREPYPEIAARDYDGFRGQVAEHIINVQLALGDA